MFKSQIRTVLVVISLTQLAFQPASAQEGGSHSVGPLPLFCVDATRPTTLLLSFGSFDAPAALGTTALDWTTGERTSLAAVPFDRCNPANGLLYGHAPAAPTTPESPALLFRSSDPQPRVIARTPTHLASDGSLLVYSLGGDLWASADGGLSWQQRGLPTDEPLFGMTVAPADGRALYLLAGSAPATGSTTPYTIFFSSDAGASWEQRATGVLENDRNSAAPNLTIHSFESAAASVASVLISTSSNSSGRYGIAQTFLSTDGGRSFRNIAASGAYLMGRVLQTSTGLLRLSGWSSTPDTLMLERSSDGGANWQLLTLPFVVRRGALPTVSIAQAFAAPDALLLSDDGDTLWFSPDGARSWQQLGTASSIWGFTPMLPLRAVVSADGQYIVRDLPDMGRSLTQPALAKDLPSGSFFPATGHNLDGVFKHTWESNGGLAQFGYPRSEPLREVNPADGRVYLVQYFERNRFEYHPEFAGTPHEVLLGLLGNQLTAPRRGTGEAPFQPVANPNTAEVIFFPETQHTLGGTFRTYWERNGAARIYGYPISEPFTEVNATDGQRYTVQYFERNRFEYHPEHAGTPSEVLLGLLGNQLLHDKGWD